MSGKNILAFEADPLYAGMLNDSLQQQGYHVDIVNDGVEGLDKAGESIPDLIYLCVELPKISGFSICTKLKKHDGLKDVPLIITSAEATPETFEKHRKLKAHADEYLHKPFSAEEIVAVVDALLNREDVETLDEDSDEMVIEEDDSVVLESDEELGDIADLEDVDEGDDVPRKPVDSDINAIADSAFDNIEVKDVPTGDVADSDRPSVSVEVRPEDTAEERGSRRESSERISILPSENPDRLKAKNEELVKKVESLEKQLIAAQSSKKSTVSSSEFLDLREALSKKDRELLDLKDAVNGREKEIVNLKDKLTALERQKADLEDKNIDVHKQLNRVEQQLENLTIDHEHLTRKSADQERRISELEDTVHTLSEELAAEKSGREADIRKERESAANAEAALKAKMEQEASEHRAVLEAKQKEFDDTLESTKASMAADKEHTVTVLRDEHAKTIESMSLSHAAQKNELNAEIASEKERVATLEGEKAGLEADLAATRGTLAETQKTLENTQQSLRETEDTLAAEKRDHQSTQDTLAETRRQLEGQVARGDGLDAVVAELKSNIEDLNNQVEELTDLISRNEELTEKAKKAVAIAAQLLEDLESVASGEEEIEEGEE